MQIREAPMDLIERLEKAKADFERVYAPYARNPSERDHGKWWREMAQLMDDTISKLKNCGIR